MSQSPGRSWLFWQTGLLSWVRSGLSIASETAVGRHQNDQHRGRQPDPQELGSDRLARPRIGDLEADILDPDGSPRAESVIGERPEKRDAESPVRKGNPQT